MITDTAAPEAQQTICEHVRRLNNLWRQPDEEQEIDPFTGMIIVVDIGEMLVSEDYSSNHGDDDNDDRLPQRQGDTQSHEMIHRYASDTHGYSVGR